MVPQAPQAPSLLDNPNGPAASTAVGAPFSDTTALAFIWNGGIVGDFIRSIAAISILVSALFVGAVPHVRWRHYRTDQISQSISSQGTVSSCFSETPASIETLYSIHIFILSFSSACVCSQTSRTAHCGTRIPEGISLETCGPASISTQIESLPSQGTHEEGGSWPIFRPNHDRRT